MTSHFRDITKLNIKKTMILLDIKKAMILLDIKKALIRLDIKKALIRLNINKKTNLWYDVINSNYKTEYEKDNYMLPTLGLYFY